jgi:hypothetical protein
MEDKIKELASQMLNYSRNYILGEISAEVYVANVNTLNFSLHEELKKKKEDHERK